MSQKFCNSILLGNYFLNKTSQLILVGEFAFVVLDFLQGGFSDQIKINLFADFYNEMEISEIFVGIPIKKINFAVNENHWRCSRKILSNLNWYHLLIVWSVMVSGILLLTYVSSYPQEIDWLVFSSEPVVSGKHALKRIFLKFLDGCFCTAIFTVFVYLAILSGCEYTWQKLWSFQQCQRFTFQFCSSIFHCQYN